MNKKTLLLIAMATAALMMVGCAKQETNNQTHDNTATNVTEGTADWKVYKNDTYGFSLDFPETWKGYTVTKSDRDRVTTFPGVAAFKFSLDKVVFTITAYTKEQFATFTKAFPNGTPYTYNGKMAENDSFVFTAYGDQDAETSAYPRSNDVAGILKTLSVLKTYSSETLEKSIIDEKNALFQGYSEMSRDLSSGYPVVFTNTTDPAVRFTKLTNSGGDAMHTTLYYINQDKQRILQIDTDVSGDFGGSGDLTLSLNGGSAIVISREKVVNDEKYEITCKGLRVNDKMVLTFKKPFICRPKGALEFTVLGVTPDLTRVYFSDGFKQYAYDIDVDTPGPIGNRGAVLEELKGLPLPSFVAKPITK